MAKICLISFDLHTGYYPSFHHGLAHIIGTLKSDNHRVSFNHLIDETDFDKTIKILNKESPDLIGLSFTTNQKKYVRDFLNRTQLDARLIVAGGAHATLCTDEIFKDFPKINGICIGEGEMPLIELCRRLDNNEDYFSVPSFYFKKKERIIKNPISPLQDIDTLALPDYSLFEYQNVIKDSGGCFPMLISRGCPYNCSYCCNHAFREIYPNKNKYVRFPSVQHAVNIIKNNLSLHPETKKIIFNDDILLLRKEWLSDFCDAYKKEIGISFRCNARIENINDEIAQCLKEAGCISVAFGIENANEWLRRHILNRKYSNKEIKEAFDVAKKHGFKTVSYNIVGLPFETKAMARDTLNLNIEIQPTFGKCYYFFPFEGTTLYQLCKSHDLFLNDLERVSGFLESPCIKEVFMTHKEMIKHFELLNVFFYSRLLLSKVQLPLLFEKWLVKIIFLLRKPILMLLNPDSSKRTIRKFRRIIRKFSLRYLR